MVCVEISEVSVTFVCHRKEKKMVAGRALHFVFKVADRALTAKFYREILGMKVTTLITRTDERKFSHDRT
jgi:hypothetical protein